MLASAAASRWRVSIGAPLVLRPPSKTRKYTVLFLKPKRWKGRRSTRHWRQTWSRGSTKPIVNTPAGIPFPFAAAVRGPVRKPKYCDASPACRQTRSCCWLLVLVDTPAALPRARSHPGLDEQHSGLDALRMKGPNLGAPETPKGSKSEEMQWRRFEGSWAPMVGQWRAWGQCNLCWLLRTRLSGPAEKGGERRELRTLVNILRSGIDVGTRYFAANVFLGLVERLR